MSGSRDVADPSARAGIDAAAALPPDRRRPGAARSFAGFARRRPSFLIGLAIVAVTIFLAVFGPLVAPHPPERALPGAGLLPPSLDHWLGTDVAGMDIFSRVISAPRIDLTIALISSLIAFVFGVSHGVVSGFFAGAAGPGRPISELIMRGADILQAFPIFIFALALVGFRGTGTENVIAALAFLNIPYFLRVTRGSVLQVRERPFVNAARCAGNSELRIAFGPRHAQRVDRTARQHLARIGFAILLTAALSFVGAGVPKPTPEWGSMISIGAPNMMTGQWWTALFPGVAPGYHGPRLCAGRGRSPRLPGPGQPD